MISLDHDRASSRRLSAGATKARNGTPLGHLLGRKLIVCMGSGGVGKTSVAAALGLGAARAGRNTAVITVDPARRLKDSLGLSDLSAHPHRVPVPGAEGILDALALDTKRIFDALIARVAPTGDIARRILENRLYQELSNNLGGSAEYMAMEKLYELVHLNTYDLIVVDTPPSSHARDLLSAPLRLSDLLASSAVRILKAPGSILSGHSGFAHFTLSALLKSLQRWTGLDLLRELSELAAGFEHLIEGFRSRAAEIELALRRPSASFLLVTTPERDTIRATIDFHRELVGGRFPVAGVIVNRLHRFPSVGPEAGLAYPEPLRHKLLANYVDFAALAERDAAALQLLARHVRLPVLASLPVLEQTPSSFDGLARFADLLVGASGSKPSQDPCGRSATARHLPLARRDAGV